MYVRRLTCYHATKFWMMKIGLGIAELWVDKLGSGQIPFSQNYGNTTNTINIFNHLFRFQHVHPEQQQNKSPHTKKAQWISAYSAHCHASLSVCKAATVYTKWKTWQMLRKWNLTPPKIAPLGLFFSPWIGPLAYSRKVGFYYRKDMFIAYLSIMSRFFNCQTWYSVIVYLYYSIGALWKCKLGL